MVFRNDYGPTEKTFPKVRFKTSLGFATSDDGINRKVSEKTIFDNKNLLPDDEIKRFYDPRITVIDGKPYLCMALDTTHGVRGCIAEIDDDFEKINIISASAPDNRNMVLFPEKINGEYVRLERPFPVYSRGGKDRFDLWLSTSPDLVFWGETELVLAVEDVSYAVVTFFGYAFNFQKPLKETDYEISTQEVVRDMDKYADIHSEIKNCGGVPTLYINGEAHAAVAYMTYLEKFNEYDDFAAAGYKFFSVPVLFSGRWISITDGLTPFKKGIFDEKDTPDFSLFDEAVEKILEACPDAYIIPRVNVSLPVRWEKENPDELNIKDGVPCRESFYSQKWRDDASRFLREFTQYASSCKYASHIVGYQIAGGQTEEWFHFDMNGGYGECAKPAFKAFLKEYYPEVEYKGLPVLTLLNKKTNYFNNEYLTRYIEFANFKIAEAISHFAQIVKKETGNNVVVGTFYGYTLEVTNPLQGNHALNYILKDKNIDFICSPNSYIGTRSPDMDWTEMYPADSVRLHGKMCFQECDIRTHLTVPLSQKAPSTDPYGLLSAPVWQPRESKYQAVNEIRKSFARQLIKGNALWWFDMWGGWYADDDIMNEMAAYKSIYEQSLTDDDRSSKAEVAVFVDESAYKYLTNCSLRNIFHTRREELGLMGTPYDIYDVYDFEAVYQNYKAVILLSSAKTAYMQNAHNLCKTNNVPYIMTSGIKEKFTVNELRAFCKTNGVHIYCETDDIIYVNKNYICIYAVTADKKTLDLGKERNISELLGGTYQGTADAFTVEMQKGETRLFRLD